MNNLDCIFCRITKGEIPVYKVFENEKTLAFLDVHPLSRGHTLVIPKLHVARLENLDKRESDYLFHAVHELVEKIQIAMKAPSTTIAINNGPESGQEIPHIHIHIIPRFKDDTGGPIHAIIRNKPEISAKEMDHIAQKIRNLID